MTLKRFKHLVNALLIGDTVLTDNGEELLALLGYAFERISNNADALKLFTTDIVDERIIRNGPGNTFIRLPRLPEYEEDELDIDEELCYAAARYVCSFISKEKVMLHIQEAEKVINSYNQKVQAFLENVEEKKYDK